MWFWILLILAIAIFFLWKTFSGNSATDTSVNSSAGSAGDILDDAAGTAGTTAVTAGDSVSAPSENVDTGDVKQDIREMIKILNLAAPDAGRLGISSETLLALRSGSADSASNEQELSAVADKLRHMLR